MGRLRVVYELHLSQLSKVAMPINSKIAYCILFSKNYRCPPRYSESEDHYVLGIYPNSVHRFYRAMHFSAKRGIAIACRLSVRPSVRPSICDVGEL